MPNIEPEHVVVAVIAKDDQVLISKRAEHVHQGGLWEFPGGKVEPGETSEQALYREIKEELAINIKSIQPLIILTHHYADKTVLLEIKYIEQYDGKKYLSSGEIHGSEGQKVKWVKRKELCNYSFPEANQAIITALYLPIFYLISPDLVDSSARETFLVAFSKNCRLHKLIQLRIKSLNKELVNDFAKRCINIAKKNQVVILINSSMRVAESVLQMSSGIHLSCSDLHNNDYINTYRSKFPNKRIAASCHCRKDIEQANALQLDFAVLSPVKHTASHPEQEPMGWAEFTRLSTLATLPVFALGGMKPEHIKEAQNHGAQGIAAISSLWYKNEQTIF